MDMKMKASEFGELKEHPVFKDLPEELKDVKRYKEIENKLRFIMVSDHKHKQVKSFVSCKRCKAKMDKRQEAIKDYGFKDYHQYLMWRRVMEIIYNQKDFQVK